MHDFACQIGVLKEDAPFIEVNCAQFTNSDMASMDIFGSEKGAFTGSTEKKDCLKLRMKGSCSWMKHMHLDSIRQSF
ncbi:hypothetical protein CF065_02235 [Clostridium sporogenes]